MARSRHACDTLISERVATPERLEAETTVARYLRAHDYRAAALAMGAYEARQATPRGIGVDWSQYRPDRDIAACRAIYERVPQILRGVRVDALEALRLGAAMAWLWGQGKPRRVWLPRDLETGTRFSADVAARMLVFFAQQLAQLAQYRQPITRRIVDERGMRVSTCPDSCAPCQAIAGVAYTIDTLPELPHVDCTATKGCRCGYSTGPL